LDFTRVWAGPLCTRILADLGAEVIKVEAPGSRRAPDAGSGEGPGSARPGSAAAFDSFRKLNRNKQSIAVNLAQTEGYALVRQLVAVSDVVVDNFSARVMPGFGLGADALLAINPGLIVASMPGFGSTGPYRDYVAYGQAIEPMTGLTSLMGYAGNGPMITGGAYPDPVAGVTTACAILTALVHRTRTGKGQFIDVSQTEATISLLGEYILAHQITGELPERMGNAHPLWSPHGCYACRGEDNWIALAVRNEQEWQALCAVEGLEALRDDPQLQDVRVRMAARTRLDARIAAWTNERDKFEAMHQLQAAGVPAGAVLTAQEMVENPQHQRTGFFIETDDPPFGVIPYPGLPIRFGGARTAPTQRAPALGEHGRDVALDLVGLGTADLRH